MSSFSSSSPNSRWICLSCSRSSISRCRSPSSSCTLAWISSWASSRANSRSTADEGLAHALLVVEHLQERLLILGFEFQIEGHEIRESSRLIHTLDQLIESLSRDPPSGAQLGSALPQLMIERLKSRIIGFRARLALHLEENRVQHPPHPRTRR